MQKQDIGGVLLLDKPSGISSSQALNKLKYHLRAKKAGHGGTLDPMATGLLPVAFGEATKFSGHLLGANKRYLAELYLGQTTDSADADGKLLRERPLAHSHDDVLAALARFRGDIAQIPPMYSALKRDGKPLYKYARAGIELEREARQIHISQLDLLFHEGHCLRLDVRCSKGTYIRTLAEDIGEVLGCGAHLSALRRTETADITLAQASTLDELLALDEHALMAKLLPVDSMILNLPPLVLDVATSARLRHGQRIYVAALPGLRRCYDGTQFLGVAEVDGNGVLRPQRLVNDPAKLGT